MVKNPGHDKFTPYKSGIAILLSLALIVQVFLFDIPYAYADPDQSGADPYDVVYNILHNSDVSYGGSLASTFDDYYEQGLNKIFMYTLNSSYYVILISNYVPVSIPGSYPYFSDWRWDVSSMTDPLQFIYIEGYTNSQTTTMMKIKVDTYYNDGISYTTRTYLGGQRYMFTPLDTSSNSSDVRNLFGYSLDKSYYTSDSRYTFYHNYDLNWGGSLFPATYQQPVDNSLISLSTASRDYPIGAIGNPVSLPVLRITPSEVSDDVYSTWDITIHAVSDKGSFDFTKTVNHPGFNDAVYFFDSSQSAYLIPIYIDVPYSQFMGSYSADDLSYLYVDSVSLIGHGADNTYKAFYFKSFAIFGTIPSTVSDDIYDDRHDDYVSPYSTVVELEKDNYLIQFTNGGIDMTEWDSIKSQYDNDIFSYALTDMDLSQIPDWADIFCYQATVGASISSSAILDNIEAVFSHQIGSINLMVVSAKNKQEALSEITSTGLQDISDVLLIVYGNSQMSLYNWEGYFTHRFYTRKLDYDVIDAINGISPQLGGILTASENEYRLFDSYYSYLHSYLDNFDDNLFNKIDGTNSRLNTVVSGLSSINSTVNNIDESLLTSVTHLSSIDTALGGTLSVSDSGSHNLLSAINTGIANLEISLSDGVDAIVDAIEAIDISVGDITIPGMPDYSGKLDQILNAIQYHKAVGQLPYHDYYSDNASDFISGMNTFFGSLGFFNTNDTFDIGGTSTAIFDSFKNTMGLYESDDYDQLEGNDGTLDITTYGVNPFTNYFSSDWDADVVTPLGGSDE